MLIRAELEEIEKAEACTLVEKGIWEGVVW